MTHDYTSTAAFPDLEDDRDAYSEYIREITGDGDTIVNCLITIMEDDDAKPYEQLDAQLLLDSIGYGRIAVEQSADAAVPQPDDAPASPPQPHPPAPWAPPHPRRPRRPAFVLSEETLFHLPALVRKKTGRGRKMADFLNAAVTGELEGFKPRHRIRAARQLAARAYSRDRDPNYGLGEIDPQSTMKLIETLTTAYKERKAREEAGPQPVPSPFYILEPHADPGPTEDHAGQPPDSTHGWYTSVLDYYPACPHGVNTCECECIEEERRSREARRELDEIVRERFSPSQEHPP